MTWPRWARAYGTALMLNLALVGELPDRRARPTIGIERAIDSLPSRFDQRELIGASVLTVPIRLGEQRVSRESSPSLN